MQKTEVEVELLTNNDMLLMVKKGTRGEICQTVNRYAKTNNRHIKNCDKNTHTLRIQMQTICMDGQCSKNVL